MTEEQVQDMRQRVMEHTFRNRQIVQSATTDGFTCLGTIDNESPWYIEEALKDFHEQDRKELEYINDSARLNGRIKVKVKPLEQVYHTAEMIEAIQTPWVREDSKGREIQLRDGTVCTTRTEVLAQVVETGNITKVTLHNKAWNDKGYIIRMDKDHYKDKRTGEVREYRHEAKNRSENAESMRRSISDLRDLINANAYNPKGLKWITLTYAENMTDFKRLYKDFEKFMKKVYYYCEKNGYPRPEYIAVAEPQARGAWHMHLILKWPDSAPWIANNDIAQMWGQGWTKTKACSDSDNLGAYLSAYLADVPLDESNNDEYCGLLNMANDNHLRIVEKTFTDDDGNIKTKRFVKGARLYMYPNGMNLYRTSRGIERPIKTETTYDDIKENIPDYGSETFSRSYSLTRGGTQSDTITQTFYNKSRLPSR